MIYRFGAFRLDPVRETLVGPDGPVGLRGHSLLVLKLLVERSPEVVTRDEILSEVWGHDALSESSIAQVIKDIRNALGDDSKSPTHVVTKYGRGYQFIAKVDLVDDDKADPDLEFSGRTRRWPWILTGALAVIVALGGLALWNGASQPPHATGNTDAPQWMIRAVEPESGESLSEPLAEYLGLVLGSAVGADQISVADDDEADIPGVRYLEVSLSVSDQPVGNRFSLTLSESGSDTPLVQGAYQEVSELVNDTMERILADLVISDESRVELGLVSVNSYAMETLLRGMAAQFSGNVNKAAELFEAALAEDPNLNFARYELAIAVRRQGEYQKALGIIQSLETRLQSNFWKRRLYNSKGVCLWRLGRLEEAAEAYQIALDATEEGINRSIIATNRALLLRDLGQFEQAEASAEQAVALGDPDEHPRATGAALNTLASIYMETGRLQEALVPLEQARELFYAAGERAFYASVLARTARVRERLGDLDTAEQLFRLGASVREQLGNDLDLAASRIDLGRIARIRGDFDEARALGRSALELAAAKSDGELVRGANLSLSLTAVASGRYDDALAYGTEALRSAELRGEKSEIIDTHLNLLEISSRAGRRTEDFSPSLDALIREAEALDMQATIVRARLIRAHASQDNGDAAAAEDDLRAAASLAESSHEYQLQAKAALALADLLLETDPGAAGSQIALAERLNAPDYPLLVLKARLLASEKRLNEALAVAFEAREKSGDWWSPEDEALLVSLQP